MALDIRPIRNEDDLTAAVARIGSLMDAEQTTDGEDEIEVLSVLVHDYELRFHPREKLTHAAVLRYILEIRELNRADLIPYLGSASRVSEVLHGKRNLTRPMIEKLVLAFSLPPTVF